MGKPSNESKLTRYLVRLLKRFTRVAIHGFILFSIIMGIVWAAPRMLAWALGS